MRQRRCHVILKLATSLDGKIALASGESRWITGPAARQEVHRLRAEVDAVGVGRGTVVADDPALTVRLEGAVAPRQPQRVVFAATAAVPAGCQLVQTARHIPTIVVHGAAAPVANRTPLTDAGVALLSCASGPSGGVDLPAALDLLAERHGILTLLVEGGAGLATAFLQAGLVDRLIWVRAPVLLGADGRPAIEALSLERLADAPRLRRVAVRPLGADIWEEYAAAGD